MLKAERRSKECASETREGDTYISNIGQEKKVPDIKEIPCAAEKEIQVTGNISYVVFDLETGGVARTSDILQISAVHESKEFNTYVTPTQPISKGASDVTKLTLVNGLSCPERSRLFGMNLLCEHSVYNRIIQDLCPEQLEPRD